MMRPRHKPPMPARVSIYPGLDGPSVPRVYTVKGLTWSGSRGWECLLSPVGRESVVARVCHCPPRRTNATCSGERLRFEY